jgi:hypothetical protein
VKDILQTCWVIGWRESGRLSVLDKGFIILIILMVHLAQSKQLNAVESAVLLLQMQNFNIFTLKQIEMRRLSLVIKNFIR